MSIRLKDYFNFTETEQTYINNMKNLLDELAGGGHCVNMGINVLKGDATLKGIKVNYIDDSFKDMMKTFDRHKKEFIERVGSGDQISEYTSDRRISSYGEWYAFWRTWMKYTIYTPSVKVICHSRSLCLFFVSNK